MNTDAIIKNIAVMNWIILLGLLCLLACEIKQINFNTKTTIALGDVAQKVGVDFHTKTNNMFGVWQVVKPK
jgi:hypothetical protein